MLINKFGTKSEKIKARKIGILHKKQGGLTQEQSTWLYEHGTAKYYRRIA